MHTVFSLVLLFVILFSNLSADIVRRAAFDFGSGKIKVQVADVDTTSQQILTTLYSEAIIVRLSEDLAHQSDGKFSQAIMVQAVEVARTLKQAAVKFGAEEFCGVATEAYRVALNGQDLVNLYLNELSIPAKIISQDAEGKFGFLALLQETKLNPAQTICWDIGGGSFQITYLNKEGRLQSYKGPFGRASIKNAIITHVKHQNPQEVSTPNPMNNDEWLAALAYFDTALPEVPEDLRDKLNQPDVQLVGISAHPERLRALGSYQSKDVLMALNDRLNKRDEELSAEHHSPNMAIGELVIIHGLMTALDVDQVAYYRTNGGSTSGLLVSHEHWRPMDWQRDTLEQAVHL